MPSKKLFLSSIVLFVLISFPLISSVWASSTMWTQTYGGTDSDIAYSLVETSDGGFALAGDTGVKTIFGTVGSADFWLVKTDALGNVEWNQTYGGAESDNAHSLVETSDGGYAIAGETRSFGAGFADFWLVKTDAYGNMEWDQTYGGADGDAARSLVETSDGGYALAGITSYSGWDIWLVKTDASGNVEWNQTYVGTGYDQSSSLVDASDGGFAIAGVTDSFGAGLNDFWLVKTDAYGNVEWNQTYGGTDYEWAHCLVEASDGGFALAGYTESFGAGGYDFWLVKTDEYGIIPEFPSWIFLTLFIAVTFVMVMFYRMRRKKLA